jgi:hypothetical protein
MKQTFATFVQRTSIMVLVLVITITGTFSFSAQANALLTVSQLSKQDPSAVKGEQFASANPGFGFDAHIDLIFEETEVEETEQDSPNRFGPETINVATQACAFMAAFLNFSGFKNARTKAFSLAPNSPLFLALRVLRL